ncbi:MAG TPA: alkaline phosphatase family protein [Solirubrobacteraceae bacterium]|nr:alkaline phosphatase family protein [Solirubrobacteraceae bacterium]
MRGRTVRSASAYGLAAAVSGVLIAAGVASAASHRDSNPSRLASRTAGEKARSGRLDAGGASGTPIRHVIEIMLENHTFDNLFGRFPGADGIPAGATLPNPTAYFTSAPDVSPVWAGPNEGDVQGGIDNSRPGLQMAMDYQPGRGYQMDNYTRYPFDGMSSITEFDPSFDPNLQYLASNYELADENFQPAIAPSNPNIHYAMAATANGWMYNNLQPGTSGDTWYSIFKELDAAGLTSKLYYGLPTPLSTYWLQQFPADRQSDATTDTQFYSDLDSGNLPTFSLVRADYDYYSEEPPEDIEEGDAWLGQVVQAIASSPEWESTAVFITYDEGGGFWDHVAPPVETQYGYGPRTPMVIVSPYARHGVFSEQTTNVSVLSFVQRLWHLPPLNGFNRRQNDLMAAFDFARSPAPAPQVPQAPTDTIAFYDSTTSPGPGKTLTVNLQANGHALTLDPNASGPVALKVTPPSGVSAPAGFPTSVAMSGGKVSFTTSFPTAGYYRIEATGPDDSEGWTTVDVGVTPNTTS